MQFVVRLNYFRRDLSTTKQRWRPPSWYEYHIENVLRSLTPFLSRYTTRYLTQYFTRHTLRHVCPWPKRASIDRGCNVH